MLTIRRVRDGRVLRNVEVAKSLAKATGGSVSASELLGLSADDKLARRSA